MQKTTSIIDQVRLIREIRFDNQHGGPYAYLQFLAYCRELLRLIRPQKRLERQAEHLEAACWLFNEYLGVRFTHSQKVIFENRQHELAPVLDLIEQAAKEIALQETAGMVHELAA
jgi:hypothetical protein